MGSIYPSNDRVANAYQATAPTNPRVGDIWVDTSTPLDLADVATVSAAVDAVDAKIVGRNLLQNGSFAVAQRGTSFKSDTSPANNDDTYTLDRWILLSDGNDIVDVNQYSAVPTGYEQQMNFDVETANKKFGVLQIVESANAKHALGGDVTFSFMAKTTGSSLTNVKAVVLAWDSTADTVTSDVVSAWGADGVTPTWATNWTAENTPTNLGVTSTWTRYSVTATLDTASTTNLAVFIWSDVTTTTVTDVLRLSGAKLEIGETPTAYDHKSYGTELRECQRYYQQRNYRAYGGIGVAWSASASQARITMDLPVSMRDLPEQTMTGSMPNGFTTFTPINSVEDAVTFDLTGGSGMLVNGAMSILANPDATTKLRLSADL